MTGMENLVPTFKGGSQSSREECQNLHHSRQLRVVTCSRVGKAGEGSG